MKSEEIVINEENFNEYFKEINKNKPEKGDIIASYRAKAYLVEGDLKKDVIKLLKTKEGVNSAVKILNKFAYCIYEDAVSICKNICQELSLGLSDEEVLKKEYPYTLEIFYYTKKENVPENDKHWSIMTIIDKNLQ